MDIRSSSGFSHLLPGAFHIALQTHNTRHTQLRGWKKRRTGKHELGLAPSARREKFVRVLFGFLVHLWAITSVYSSEIPTQPSGMLTHPLTLANSASESTGPSSLLCSRLSLTVTFPKLLLIALFYWLPTVNTQS